MFEVLEMMPVFLIYMSALFALFMFMVAIWYVGVFVLFCVYKHNGGKYSFNKFVATRELYL